MSIQNCTQALQSFLVGHVNPINIVFMLVISSSKRVGPFGRGFFSNSVACLDALVGPWGMSPPNRLLISPRWSGLANKKTSHHHKQQHLNQHIPFLLVRHSRKACRAIGEEY
mmetsp:Transcript_35450/g.35963  ORF Transcript_35450/g.35963 Transcript_35450/m.35963 type:complete len:112 (+) Transcript_35450:278-613(+)